MTSPFSLRFYTSMAAAGILAYHVVGLYLVHRGAPRLPGEWRSAPFHLKAPLLGDRSSSVPRRDPPPLGAALDPAEGAIRGVGYVARFLSGETPDWMKIRHREGKIEIFQRSEASFATAESVAVVGKSTERIVAAVRRLEARGVTVVFLPIPTKISMTRLPVTVRLSELAAWESIPRRQPASVEPEDPRRTYEAALKAGGPRAVDLYRRMEGFAERHRDVPLYVGTDTHWSSAGIAVGAEAIVDHLRRRGWPIADVRIEKDGVRREMSEFWLLNVLQLPWWFRNRYPPLRWTEHFYRVVPAASRRRPGRLVVFGSSYSNQREDFGGQLGAQLAEVLGMPLHQFAVSSQGALGGARRAVKEGFRFRAGDLLVWEFPILTPVKEDWELPDLSVDG